MNHRRFFRIALLPALLGIAVVCCADVKVVSKVTVSMSMGSQRQPETETETTYYKGTKSRVESKGQILLIGVNGKRMILLDPADKTYKVLDDETSSANAKQHLKMSAKVKPSGEKMKILGNPAQKYLIDINASGPISAGTDKGSQGSMSMTIHADQWMASGLGQFTNSQILGSMQEMLRAFSAAGDVTQVTAELKKLHGLPLNIAATVRFDLKGQGAAGAMSLSMTMTSTAQSISTKPLSASLFQIPAGYKKAATR